MEKRICFPLKLSIPSPQLTPIPTAIEVLSIDTFPEGSGLCAGTAVVASAKTSNRAILETVRNLHI
jgi:hypothetical protein